LSRCVLTIYPDDTTSYIGFFESINDVECAKLLFEKAKEISIENNCSKILGPVDSSFWIKYRLKTNNFSRKVFVGEPGNREYYLGLFLACGYKVYGTYISNYYNKLPLAGYGDRKCSERYERFRSQRVQDSFSEGEGFRYCHKGNIPFNYGTVR
jgi:hypothetical protein